VNLINIQISKVTEAKDNTENALRKNNENFSHDTQKFSTSLKNSERENEFLKNKLTDNEKEVYNANIERTNLESRLNQNQNELDDQNRNYTLENEDKLKRISLLHAELKELQERVDHQNVSNSLLDSKNKDLDHNYCRISTEQVEIKNRMN
jgi:ABC-type phosphate transport system auxiliary subunit